MKSILNVITQVLAYLPTQGISDNPNQRHFDWTRKLHSVELSRPDSDTTLIPPGGNFTIFDGSETNPLDGSSILGIAMLPQCGPSAYRLSVSAGTSGFRTPRTITGLGVAALVLIQDLTYTSAIAGQPGNATTIAYTAGATAGAEVVTVTGQAISVQIDSGVSTALQVQTAVLASPAAVALVTVAISGTSSNPQTAPVTATALAGAQYTLVSINNDALATFNFGSASLGGVVPGDILRISGVAVFDGVGPFAFNPINAGFWSIIGVAGSTLSAVRLAGQQFTGVAESVGSQPSDIQIYSAAGIQVGDKISITGTFNLVTQSTYQITAVTPTSLDFISTAVIPVESGITYVPTTIQFYTNAKRFVYLEVDQSAAVQFNADTSQNVRVDPIVPSDHMQVGYLHKWGNSYKCVVQNLSVNPMIVKYFTGE